MCGIAGFIGESRDTGLSFRVLTALFEKAESRGLDASGFWMSECGSEGKVTHHKQPGRSSEYVRSKYWLSTASLKTNLAIVHARGASRGSGSPTVNKNNHPFVSETGNIALVHNGRIEPSEYEALVQKYKVKSECDSEILLRIFESSSVYSDEFLDSYVGDCEHRRRIAGIKDIFSLINEGHMAVAIAEWLKDGERNLWLFRNEHRPLWVADARAELGQTFFFSEPSMWRHAVSACGSELKRCKITEVPEYELWHLSCGNDSETSDVLERYMVSKSNPKVWQSDGAQVDFVVDEVDLNFNSLVSDQEHDVAEDATDKMLTEIERKVEKIQTTCRNIYALSQIMTRSKSLSAGELEQLVSLLDEQQKSIAEIESIFD